MIILVVGSGAREHALVTSLKTDESVERVICAPGNAGIARDVESCDLDVSNPEAIGDLAADLRVDLVVIGPEVPLVTGAADAVRARGIACFGPSAAAARLEGSKAFAKQVMDEAGVDTARAHVCRVMDEVAEALDQFGAPHVVKDDGLAAGKGVVVTNDRDEALAHAQACLSRGGDARVVIEEYLDGPEVSLFGISDGTIIIPLEPAQDFKRAYDNDAGPNTGGMGAYSPLPWAPPNLVADVTNRVLQPMIDTMRERGTPFVGLLYAGLALTTCGMRVIEFNARFGDPETQVVLARLASPLGQVLLAAATGTLGSVPPLEWHQGAAVTVVIASKGYPENPVTGDLIEGLDAAGEVEGVTVLHAGTRATAHGIVTAGGRVLSITAQGESLAQARNRAYEAIDHISIEGAHHRSDIALAAALDA